MSYGRPPPDVEGMTSLKVDNLTYRTSPETLRRVFEKYGRVGDVYIPRDRYTKESRGFAFVRFHDKRDAEDAMDAMDGALLDGRELRVQMARYGRPPDSHHGGAVVAVEVMVAVAEALPPAPGGGDVADPAAGVGPVPTAGPDTAGPGPAPTRVPSPPRPKGRPRQQPSPRHDPAPGPSPRASPDHVPLPPTKGLGPDLKAPPSLPQFHQQGRTEDRLLKAT
ncbi:unnamed protein product [Boreogadus saida]